LLSSVGDGIQVNNSGQLLHLTDEAGNRITDELGNYIAIPFGGIIFDFSVGIAVGEAYHVNSAGAPSLIQHHVVGLSETSQANVADAPAPIIAGDNPISLSDGAQGNVADSPSVYQNQAITVSDSSIANAADEPDLTSFNITVGDAVQENNSGEIYYLSDEDGNNITDEAGNPIVIDWFGGIILTENEGGDTSVTAADGAQVNVGDSPSLRQAHLLTSVADGAQVNSGDSLSVTQAHTLSVDDGANVNIADGVVAVPEVSIGTGSGVQVNTADGISLIQHHNLSVSDSDVVNAGDGATTPESVWATAGDGAQANAGDDVTLISGFTFTVSDAANLSVAEALVVLIGHAMSPQDSGQVNEADAITLIHGHTLTISDGAQPQYADGIDFGDSVVAGDSYHSQSADSVVLELHTIKHGKKTVPSVHPVRDKYRQSKVYVNTYRRAGDVWRSR